MVEERISYLIEKSHGMAVSKGFWEGGRGARNTGELLALIHSEVSEALEADRDHNYADEDELIRIFSIEDDKEFFSEFEKKIKNTFQDEIADVNIRLFDLAGGFNINHILHINAKMRFNSMRGNKHGKNY